MILPTAAPPISTASVKKYLPNPLIKPIGGSSKSQRWSKYSRRTLNNFCNTFLLPLSSLMWKQVFILSSMINWSSKDLPFTMRRKSPKEAGASNVNGKSLVDFFPVGASKSSAVMSIVDSMFSVLFPWASADSLASSSSDRTSSWSLSSSSSSSLLLSSSLLASNSTSSSLSSSLSSPSSASSSSSSLSSSEPASSTPFSISRSLSVLFGKSSTPSGRTILPSL